jgi:hypothetical protein
VGDQVWIDKTTDEWEIVNDVNLVGDNYIGHAVLSSGAAASGDTVKRSFVESVYVARDGYAPIRLKYGQDYTEYTDATNKLAGFTLTDDFENSYTAATEPFNGSTDQDILQATDIVYCKVYGNTNQETLSASAFGSDGTGGCLTQAIVIIYSILKNHVGLTEAEIDTSTFTTLQGSVTDEIGLAIPQIGTDDFPRYRDVLTLIFQSLLSKFLIDDSGLYSLKQTGPVGAVSKTIEDDEILQGSFEYQIDYKDIISFVIVEYKPSEVGNRAQTGELYYSKATSFSDLVTRLHGVTKQKTFQSLHFTGAEAQVLANRLRYALSERRGRIMFKTKNRFFDAELNDAVRISRSRQPGFSYVAGTTQDRDGAIVSAMKSLQDIEIEIDDQKGIEDNSASW